MLPLPPSPPTLPSSICFRCRYGPETASIRTALQRYTELKLEDLFPTKPDGRCDVDSSPTTAKVLDDVQDQILGLKPATSVSAG